MVREAPRLEQDAELSETDEARLYAHYGIQSTADEPLSKAVQVGQQAAASGRLAVHRARQEVAAVVAAIETAPESKRAARRRARARKRIMAAGWAADPTGVAAVAAVLQSSGSWRGDSNPQPAVHKTAADRPRRAGASCSCSSRQTGGTRSQGWKKPVRKSSVSTR